jgi:hypothetical protein
MKPERRSAFDTAFLEWLGQPVTVSHENAFLFHSSNSLVSVQDDVTPAMVQLHETGKPLAAPMAQWHGGMSYLLIRETTALRRHLRMGRNQVATRVLIDDSLRLQRAWDAYRKLIDE